MLSTYDMQCLGRLEDRWADPDYNIIPEDEEDSDLDFLRGDDDYIERWVEERRTNGNII